MPKINLESKLKKINRIGDEIPNVGEEEESMEEKDVEEMVQETINKNRPQDSISNQLKEVTDAQQEALGHTQLAVTENLNRAITKAVDNTNNVRQMTRDLTYLKGASDLQTNEKFNKQYQTELAGQLLSDLKNEGTRQAIIDEAKKLEARNLRNEAYYNGFADMFRMMKIGAPFGLIPMIIMTVFILPIYLIFKVCDFIFNAINELLLTIADFGKVAKAFCVTIIIIALTVLLLLGVMWLINLFTGIDLLGMFKA